MCEFVRGGRLLFHAGRADVVTDDVQNLTGTPATPFRTWAQKHTDLFA
ncbi:hypothetical protein V6S67_08875 [Arthrobacter sp. Soc17.1.1.1]